MELTFNYELIKDVALQLIPLTRSYSVFAFYGNLGAGKTTLIKEICKRLEIEENVSSPTYSIINQYTTNKGEPVFHIDLYRLNNFSEVIEAGVEECINSSNLCFIEWPERAPGLFSERTVKVYLDILSERDRKMNIELPLKNH